MATTPHYNSINRTKASPPPPLYDTSESSATNDDSRMEQQAVVTPKRTVAALGRVRPASEPGDHDRFLAYVNRFAAFDPRMDYRDTVAVSDVGSGSRSSHSLTSAALHAAQRTHSGRSHHSEARLSRILHRKQALKQSTMQQEQRPHLENELQTRQPVPQHAPAISRPSLLRAVTDMRAGKPVRMRRPTPPPQKHTARSSTPPTRSHHFVSPPTSPDTSARSQSAAPRIQRVDDRSAIEIPSPSKVRELRARLWTPNERLRVPSKSKPRHEEPSSTPHFPDRYVQAAERTPIAQRWAERQAEYRKEQERQQRRRVVSPEQPPISDEESADSTVSSITNPTYQPETTKKSRKAARTPSEGQRTFAELRKDLHEDAANDSGIIDHNDDDDDDENGSEADIVGDKCSDSGILTRETPPVTTQRSYQRTNDDEVSDGVIPSVTATPQAMTEQQHRRRQHPWDNTTTANPEVQCKETSMQSADGIEAMVTTTPQTRKVTQREWSSPTIIEEQERSDISAAGEEQLAVAAANDAVALLGEKKKESYDDTPYEPFAKDDDDAALEGDDTKDIEFTGFVPLENAFQESAPPVRLDQATADVMANEFDSAWVNVPASKYFGLSERQLKRSSRSSSRRKSRSQQQRRKSSSRQRSTEEGLERPRSGYVPVELPTDDERFTAPKKSTRPSSYRRRQHHPNLHSYLDKNRQQQQLDERTSFSGGDHKTYTSTGSRRFKDLRTMIETTGQAGTLHPARGGGGEHNAAAAEQRNRSRSVETKRARNPKIAKKYSRVLRVYENDGRGW